MNEYGGWADKMINEQSIRRINELAKKQKTVGLTDAEAREQQELRKQYLANFRSNLRSQLDRIKFVEDDGQDSKPH